MDDDFNHYDDDMAMTKQDLVDEMDLGDEISDDDMPRHTISMDDDMPLGEDEEYGLPGPTDPDDPDGGDVLYPVEYIEDLSTALDVNIGEPYISLRPARDGSISQTGTSPVQGLMRTPITSLRSSAMLRQKGVRFQRVQETRQPGTVPAKKIIISGHARRSSPLMTKFEYASIIGERATEIEHGARDIDPKIIALAKELGITSSLDIAEMELEDTSVNFPMTIHRDVAPGKIETWEVRELRLPSQVLCDAYTPEAAKLLTTGTCMTNHQMTNLQILKRFALADTRI